MTVIAFDGRTLAADKQTTSVGLKRTVTKVFKVYQSLIGFAGGQAASMAMKKWFEEGKPAECFPEKLQSSAEMSCTMVEIRKVYPEKVEIWIYEQSPEPARIEDSTWATGCGRDYALAAMHLGKSAREAVEVACHFDAHCGMGIDEVSFS